VRLEQRPDHVLRHAKIQIAYENALQLNLLNDLRAGIRGRQKSVEALLGLELRDSQIS